jgi:hypothetical protein
MGTLIASLIALPILFIILIVVFQLFLPLIAIIDILTSRFEGNDGLLMALIVVFIPFGAIVYFFIAPSRKLRN